MLECRDVCRGLFPPELLGVFCYAGLPAPTGGSPRRIKYGGLCAQEDAWAFSFPKQPWVFVAEIGPRGS